ncbi:hypothetical protein P4U90_20625 [Cytobacillus kochii]|uniref:hypothetical protein n=1 Tax=Cytobacillus TaxID=2675230 RepID=UPI0025A29138|nr:hypothetical protein [Cytobacillus kochii]MDM5205934.1 hypothetical protein [Cytobacillus kochii]MED1607729.1 hypothetical protein [Cytobacillus kochii]
MKLSDTVGKDIKIICTDDTEFQVRVLSYTSELDNEPDDDGNYGGAYIYVRTLKPTAHFMTGGEFAVHEYEIRKISTLI